MSDIELRSVAVWLLQAGGAEAVLRRHGADDEADALRQAVETAAECWGAELGAGALLAVLEELIERLDAAGV